MIFLYMSEFWVSFLIKYVRVYGLLIFVLPVNGRVDQILFKDKVGYYSAPYYTLQLPSPLIYRSAVF